MSTGFIALNADDTYRLAALAAQTQEAASALTVAASELRDACKSDDGGAIFDALRKFESAHHLAHVAGGATISEAVSKHGFY